MKKLFALTLALLMCVSAASAEGFGSWFGGLFGSAPAAASAPDTIDSEFDILFNSGKTPVLEREYIDVSKVPVYVSAEFARANAESFGVPPESIGEGLVPVGTAGDIAGGDAKYFFPLAVSPDGGIMCTVFSGVVLCYDGEKLIAQTMSVERSVPDEKTGTDLAVRLASSPSAFMNLIGSTDGVIWAPDGSKAVLLNSYSFLSRMDTSLAQLIIMDVQAGDIYLVRRFSNRRTEENFGAVTGACFDESGRYVYYTVYGNPPSLRRHDTETGEDILVQNVLEGRGEFPDRPRLYLTRNGSFLTLFEGSSRGDYGLLLMYESSGRRYYKKYETGLKPLGRLLSFEMNAQSGLGIVLNRDGYTDPAGGYTTSLLVIDTDQSMYGLGQPVMFKTDGSAVRLNKTQYTKLIDENAAEDYEYLYSACLSPDGEYALVTARNCMYLLRLRTLETLRLELPEGTEPSNFVFDASLNPRFRRGIEWPFGDMICSSGGMYRLTWK